MHQPAKECLARPAEHVRGLRYTVNPPRRRPARHMQRAVARAGHGADVARLDASGSNQAASRRQWWVNRWFHRPQVTPRYPDPLPGAPRRFGTPASLVTAPMETLERPRRSAQKPKSGCSSSRDEGVLGLETSSASPVTSPPDTGRGQGTGNPNARQALELRNHADSNAAGRLEEPSWRGRRAMGDAE